MNQPSLKDYSLVILCGGKSSRMGEDKALLPFASYDTLVQYQFERLKPFFKNIYLSSKVNKFDFLDSDKNIIYDKGDVFSPMVALQTIFQAVKEEKVFILTVDTPFVSLQTMEQLLEASTAHEIAVAKTERLHSLCGFFHKKILYKVENLLEQDIHKIGALLKKCDTSEVPFFDENEFLNLNKKEDYQQALTIIRNTNNNY